MKRTVINWVLDPEEKIKVDKLKKMFGFKTRTPIIRMAFNDFFLKNFKPSVPVGTNATGDKN